LTGKTLNILFAISLVGSYISSSYFSLFELFGIRGEVQLVFVVLTIVLCIIKLSQIASIKYDGYAAIIGLLAVFFGVKNIEYSVLVTLLYSLLVYITLVNSSLALRQKIMNYTIGLLFVLSILAIVQFLIIAIFGVEVAKDLALFNDAYFGSNSMILFDLSAYGSNEYAWLRLMGLSDAKIQNIGGVDFSNVRSFLHEPSLALSLFYMPAAAGI